MEGMERNRTTRVLRIEEVIDRAIAHRIRQRRTEMGLSIADLAVLTGLHEDDLRESDHLPYVVSPARLLVVCRALGLDPSEVFEGLPDPIA